jgi:SpoVK/Ycf46/Vps4 family AAA+-type ATPase
VNLPDKVGREAILKVHTRSVPLARGVDLGGRSDHCTRYREGSWDTRMRSSSRYLE